MFSFKILTLKYRMQVKSFHMMISARPDEEMVLKPACFLRHLSYSFYFKIKLKPAYTTK